MDREAEEICSEKGDTWAGIIAEDFVRQSLIAPTTAKFPSRSEFEKKWDGKCGWRVRGYVDAQNANGAQIRRHFITDLYYSPGNDRWSMGSLDWH